MSKRIFFLLASVAATAGTAVPASAPARQAAPRPLSEQEQRFAADFDAFLASAAARLPDVPSIAVAVARGDRPIYLRAVGSADLAARRPATPDTLYYIASSTKSFLGLAFAALDARGEIDLDWTLAELAPDISFAPELQADRVTLRHLLSHTHGLSCYPIVFRLAFTGEHDPATLWRLLRGLRQNREAPLGTYRYTNLGYNVAAMLVERRLHRRWQDIVDREVLAPLGMAHSLTQNVARARRQLAFAAPYTTMVAAGTAPVYLVKEDDTMQSAGGMFASARDLARWVQVQLAAERGTAAGRLPAAVIAATHRPIGTMDDRSEMFRRTGYGLGWYSGDHIGHTLYHSFGGFPGARAHVSFMPGRDLGVVALSNDDGAGAILADVVAAYAYSWFAEGPAAANAAGNALIERVVGQLGQRRARIAAARAEQAARPWRLSLPAAAYAGRYCNAELGTITISERNGHPAMAMGRLRAEGGPFDQPDAVRMEPIPGEGWVMRFEIRDGAPAALTAFDNYRFDRCR
ncbi:MAG TPA: serine hydrolase [Allosphingosinicella sp.]|nr:serine hydrolase [Allosphingosinicella sp.]